MTNEQPWYEPHIANVRAQARANFEREDLPRLEAWRVLPLWRRIFDTLLYRKPRSWYSCCIARGDGLGRFEVYDDRHRLVTSPIPYFGLRTEDYRS